MYCKYCASQIDDDCIICPKCGKQVGEIKSNSEPTPVIINNSASSSASAAASVTGTKRRKHYNFLIDLILICCTGGLWLIWMLIRPKYEY